MTRQCAGIVKNARFAILLFTLIGVLPWPSPAAEDRPVIVAGWIERVTLGAEGVLIKAKLDTGATTSSLHAADLRWLTRDDGDWVAFDVVGENGQKAHFERKVTRIARVKRRGAAAAQKRPTVIMGVCLGNIYRLVEVNLADRTGFNYKLLVGRNFLKGHFMVDSGRTYTAEPRCEPGRGQ
ncbi:MAG: hypothetical protein A3G24_02880 [Betaproteobacteria bacterium RIFCSPLOWO2_12_FULL_62_13]|nr:MAG: hypothetical protein A3G24_02880 [Betaproteobacteria bacterium RIFCSPLOWO2_12_FULL_62_13]